MLYRDGRDIEYLGYSGYVVKNKGHSVCCDLIF